MRAIDTTVFMAYLIVIINFGRDGSDNGAIRAIEIINLLITGSAVALHCCKAHSNINRKMENSTPCKMVTPDNIILKLGTRDYVEEVTHYTIFDADRLSGGFSPNR